MSSRQNYVRRFPERADPDGIGRKRHASFVAEVVVAVQRGLSPADAAIAAITAVYPRLKSYEGKRSRLARVMHEPKVQAALRAANISIDPRLTRDFGPGDDMPPDALPW